MADRAPAGPPAYQAVILAGGAARRLGGIDKPALPVGGITLLDRVLQAVADADRVVAVGPVRPTARPVTWTREEPAGAGPVAAVAAGLRHVDALAVAVLAADMPFLRTAAVAALRAALAAEPATAGAIAVDAGGVDQVLLGVWRTAALRRAVSALPPSTGRGVPLRRLLDSAPVLRVPLAPVGGPGGLASWFDCDTDDDLRLARAAAAGRREEDR